MSPRLLAEVRDSERIPPSPAADREWLAMTLHACVRGVAERKGDDVAELVDAFHDEVLSGREDEPELRAFIAQRYARYDGLVRTLGPQGFAQATLKIARACARSMAAVPEESFATTVAPLLESIAEGAAATVAGAEPKLPPLEPLQRLTSRLDAASLPWALGASGLLASLGLVDEVNDWDVQVDADPDAVRALFAGESYTFHGHGGCHADWKLAFEAERAELIPRFAFFVPAGIVRIPLHVSGRWRELPIAGLEAWAVAYWLLGEYDEPALRPRRASRAEALFAHLERSGADAAHVEELLDQPLPERLAARLLTLPRK